VLILKREYGVENPSNALKEYFELKNQIKKSEPWKTRKKRQIKNFFLDFHPAEEERIKRIEKRE